MFQITETRVCKKPKIAGNRLLLSADDFIWKNIDDKKLLEKYAVGRFGVTIENFYDDFQFQLKSLDSLKLLDLDDEVYLCFLGVRLDFFKRLDGNAYRTPTELYSKLINQLVLIG